MSISYLTSNLLKGSMFKFQISLSAVSEKCSSAFGDDSLGEISLRMSPCILSKDMLIKFNLQF